jgi:hypothetical protein
MAAKKRTTEKSFDKLTAAQKRVRIARDVLAQLAAGKFIATQGLYVEGVPIEGAKSTASLQTLFKKQKSCEVCALGSMFVASVERKNALNAGDLNGADLSENGKKVEYFGEFTRSDCTDYLGKFFDHDQLNQIEDCFEGGSCDGPGDVDFYVFFDDEVEADERMRLIMENIVANGGTFKPEIKPTQRTVYETPGFKG